MSDARVIASGNLATHHRTISGLLGQLAFLDVPDSLARSMFRDAGLPGRALEQPDFPISLPQEMRVALAIAAFVERRGPVLCALFAARHRMGIENFGALGMAMRHAATALESLEICLAYPQLTHGHSRMVVRRAGDTACFAFHMERPELRDVSDEETEALMQYCLALDLLTSWRNIEDVLESSQQPLEITFAFPAPGDWETCAHIPDCPLRFSADETSLLFPSAIDNSPLPRANPVAYRNFVSVADTQSRMLADDTSLTERVSRWLWAYTPPLSRGEVARQLAISERSLTRQLAREGSSYAQLLAKVQEERARNYLRNGSLSVSEVGYRLGYAEPAAFSRAFKGWTGQSPLQWRRTLAG